MSAIRAPLPRTPRAEGADDERASNERPVHAIGPAWLEIAPGARLPAYSSHALAPAREGAQTTQRARGAADESVTSAVVLVHGRLRNADAYYAFGAAALQAAPHGSPGTVLVAPQFLAQADVEHFGLPADTLRWEWTGWMGGEASLGAAGLSSFAALDALVARLAEPGRFPQLRRIVLAGHSGGAQVVHRYAIVARQQPLLAARAIGLRYVVANPSSYLYFDDLRPGPDGSFVPYAAAGCPGFDRWKYGPAGAPSYVSGQSFVTLEQQYAARDVVYLWGANDNDPGHPALDTACAAQAQGPHRLARGRYYLDYLKARHGARLQHRGLIVPATGHDGLAMFTSPQAAAALFGV